MNAENKTNIPDSLNLLLVVGWLVAIIGVIHAIMLFINAAELPSYKSDLATATAWSGVWSLIAALCVLLMAYVIVDFYKAIKKQ